MRTLVCGGRDAVMPTPSQLDGTGLHDLSVAGGGAATVHRYNLATSLTTLATLPI